MKVLLLGDCSKVHLTLSQGLNEIGVDARVASQGDGWKGFQRDIDISTGNRTEMVSLLLKLLLSPQFRGYDVVQFINYVPFLNTQKWSKLMKIFIAAFKKNNEKLFLGAFGDDYFWVKACQDGLFDYSFLHMYKGREKINEEEHARNSLLDNASPQAQMLNSYFAEKSDGIIAGLYDYWLPYSQTKYANKLDFIPFPINTKEIKYIPNTLENNKVSFLIGSQKGRYLWKGLDLVCPILEEYATKYPNDIKLTYVENCRYDEYVKIMSKANVVVDQVYSMGQGMNALTSMAYGKMTLSGGEDCHYDLVGELHNKPVVNIKPDLLQIRNQLESILGNRHELEEWGGRCRKYIEDHHDYIRVAEQYLRVWNKR